MFFSHLYLNVNYLISRNTQLKLLLEYIYTGEICASKGLMQEFELCLKELGILGTHSYTSLDGKLEKHASCVPQSLKSVETSISNPNTLIQETSLNHQMTPHENHQLLEQNHSTSEPSDSENALSEEEMNSSTEKLSRSGKRSCSICNQHFSSINELKIHLKDSHSRSSERPYVCPVCQKAFRHLNVLRTHSRVHTGN